MATEQSTTRLATVGGRAPLLVQANALHIPLADQSVSCIVTSPPFYGLRDYGTGTWEGGAPACDHSPADTPQRRGIASSMLGGGKATTGHQREGYGQECARCKAVRIDDQLGLEKCHDCNGAFTGDNCNACYICGMRKVARELWRILRDDGVMFINIGDSYNAAGRNGHGTRIGYKQGTNRASANGQDTHCPTASTLKGKNLLGIPWRLALALQQDGWILRADIIWHKSGPMPESVQDRVTKAHEYVFMFSKQEHYFYDAQAIAEPCSTGDNGSSFTSAYDAATKPGLGQGPRRKSEAFGQNGRNIQATNSESERRDLPGTFNNNPKLRPKHTRNARSVWTIATEPTSEAHFATFPTELVRRCILAGTSAHGVCSACGAPWRRVVERESHQARLQWRGANRQNGCPVGGGHRGRTGQWSSEKYHHWLAARLLP